MRKISIYRQTKAVLLGATLALPTLLFAGNEDRIGQSGAQELLINPWARSSGMAGANTAFASGLESTNLNVAGLAFTKKTEVIFAHTRYLGGSQTGAADVNSFGFSQKVGDASVIGLSVFSMSFGDIPITTTELPEGGAGTFAPQLLNLGLSFAKEFSNSIYGGVTVRTISQSISNMAGRAVAIDAGIRYVTGKRENLKFGIALRNIGPKMNFSGDGIVTSVTLDDKSFSLNQRTQAFELPAILNMGASYDIYFGGVSDSSAEDAKPMFRLTPAVNFMSNSFGKDQLQGGAEFAYKEFLFLRGGYNYERGITDIATRTTIFTGPTAGFSIDIPLNKENGSTISIDYAIVFAERISNNHLIGARINL